jgi:type II secretory pathway pseudopilin PulG
MIKKAFTLIELIFIIVLIGILSGVASAYLRDDKLALATYQILEHIRYTQHLAISDHKFDPKDTYYVNYQAGSDGTQKGKYFRSWWQMRFVNQPGVETIIGYSVYSDKDRDGNIDGSAVTPTHIEPAINPFDGKLIYARANCNKCSADANLYSKYDVSDINLIGGCSVAGFTQVNSGNLGTIAFDEKGRPYYGIASNIQNNPYQYRLSSDCNITIAHQDGRKSIITVYPETGYAEITKLE